MLVYNTQQDRLKLPEYGRSIQKMLDHCLAIGDREERNKCAKSIVKCMVSLMPDVKGTPEDEMRLWEHLRLMSDFKLDVDFPYPITTDSTTLQTPPERVDYGKHSMRYKHYGVNIENSVAAACEMEASTERDALVLDIANQMKKDLAASSLDDVDDSRIFNDLLHMSSGRINLVDGNVKLHDYKFMTPPSGKKKKKK